MADQANLTPDNWLEKIGIVRDIGDIKIELVRLNAQIGDSTRTMHEHHRTLYGDGGGYVGMDKLVDRLIEIEKSRSKHLFVIYSAIVALVIDQVWHWIGTK